MISCSFDRFVRIASQPTQSGHDSEVNEFAPSEPNVSTDALTALVVYARDTAAWLKRDLNEEMERGVMPHPKQLRNIEGWRFMALALTEMQMLNPTHTTSSRTEARGLAGDDVMR